MKRRVGGLPIQKVGAILLGLMVVALVFAATQGMFDSTTSNFMSGIDWPAMSGG